MRFRAEVIVTLKNGVLDTQGKAVLSSLSAMGHAELHDVRIGRVAHLIVEAPSVDDARSSVEKMCRDLLVNDLIEEFRLSVAEA